MARTSEYEVAEMKRLLAVAGYSKALGKWEYSSYSDANATKAREEGRTEGREQGVERGRREIAQLVIRVYGLDYPDSTRTEDDIRLVNDYCAGYGYSRYSIPRYETYERTVTIPGSDAFLADLEAVANSQKVKGARKRIGL